MAPTKLVAAEPSATDTVAAKLGALRHELNALNDREARANAVLESLARDLPSAQTAMDLALAQADSHPGQASAADALRKLQLEQANAESVLRGIAIRRQQLACDIADTEVRLARARARASLPAQATAELAEEAITEGFAHLAEVIAGGLRSAIGHSPRDDHRGITEAFDEAQLARWIVSQCSQAGLNLDLAKHAQHGSGCGPADTLHKVRTLMETL